MRLRDEAPGNRGCPRRSDVCVTCQVSHAKLSKINLGEQILVTRLPVQVLTFGWKPDRLSGLSGLVRSSLGESPPLTLSHHPCPHQFTRHNLTPTRRPLWGGGGGGGQRQRGTPGPDIGTGARPSTIEHRRATSSSPVLADFFVFVRFLCFLQISVQILSL